MSDAQQEPSPDFVLMRLVSAAEYDRLDEPEDRIRSGGGGFGPVKAALGHRGGGYDVDPSGPSSGLGSGSPHYSSPLPGKGELDGGLVLTQVPLCSEPPLSPPPEDFGIVAQRFVDGSGVPGTRAQLMVFQNLLRSGDRILEFRPEGFLQEEAERQHLDPGLGSGSGSNTTSPGPGGGPEQNSCCVPSAEENLQWHPVLRLSKGSEGSQNLQWVPVLDSESGPVLCLQHRLAKWPPGLLDQALRLGLLEPRKTCSSGGEDPVLVLAQRLGQMGELKEGVGVGGEDLAHPTPRCSCHSVLGSGGPGEDPSDTSDALLVLEGLGSEEVGGLGHGGGREGEEAVKGEDVGGISGVGNPGGSGPVFSSGTLSGLMQQVHRLAEEAGVCTDQNCCSSMPTPISTTSYPTAAGLRDPQVPPELIPRNQSRSQPQSRAATPRLGVALGGTGQSASPLVVLEGEKKSRKGGSLKVRLSKLFRTKSSGGGSGGLLDKRPSLASSTSSGGSLLDVWGSTCSNMDQDSIR